MATWKLLPAVITTPLLVDLQIYCTACGSFDPGQKVYLVTQASITVQFQEIIHTQQE